jgi:hypothetical protein
VVTTEPADPVPHPVDRLLKRKPDNEAIAKFYRDQTLNDLEHMALASPSLADITGFSDSFLIYLFAHRRGEHLLQKIPVHLQPLAAKAQKHVDGGGVFSLDHALGIDDPPFQGAKPKEPGAHKHQRLFLIAFYELQYSDSKISQIDALRYAAEIVSFRHYVEKNLDGEFRDWQSENRDWLIWVFDLV